MLAEKSLSRSSSEAKVRVFNPIGAEEARRIIFRVNPSKLNSSTKAKPIASPMAILIKMAENIGNGRMSFGVKYIPNASMINGMVMSPRIIKVLLITTGISASIRFRGMEMLIAQMGGDNRNFRLIMPLSYGLFPFLQAI